MIPMHYVWLFWSLAFLAAFALVYAAARPHRQLMLRAALGTAPFGLTEPLFVPAYWNPPSLFDLAQRTGFDLESVIFAFSIGGVGAVLYNVVTRHQSRPVLPSEAHRYHRLALATPAVVFLALAPIGWNPIYPALIAMAAGAGATLLCRPDLYAKTLLGGVLFLAFYGMFMIGLRVSAPGYIEQVWNWSALWGLRIAGIPLEELLFGAAFGLYWAGVYEHLTWSRPIRIPNRPAADPAQAGRVRP